MCQFHIAYILYIKYASVCIVSDLVLIGTAKLDICQDSRLKLLGGEHDSYGGKDIREGLFPSTFHLKKNKKSSFQPNKQDFWKYDD